MASTFGILESAKSGLSVAMENLNITGHNIANASTVGYSRQRLVTSAKEASNSAYLVKPADENQVGQGVEVLAVQQIRSEYLDDQYRDLNAGYCCSESTTQSLTYLEGLFNSELEEGSGLTGSVEEFFSALNTFTQDTTSEENRIAVQKSALGLTQNFNLVYQEMEALWADQNDDVATVAQKINSAAEKLTGLNEAIANYERGGETANDLRDERNLLLDELSGYVDITYSNNETNSSMVDVQIGGVDLVSGTTANTIEVGSKASDFDQITSNIAGLNAQIALATDSAVIATLQGYIDNDVTILETAYGLDLDVTEDGDMRNISYDGTSLVTGSSSSSIADAVKSDLTTWVDLCSNTLELDGTSLGIAAGTVTGGALYAHLEQISSTDSANPGIPYYMGQLNALAQSIAQGINDIHLTGYSYDTDESTDVTTSKTGIYFFDVETESDAGGNVTAEYYSKITAGNFTISDDVAESVWNIAGSSVPVYSDGTTMDAGNSEVASLLYANLSDDGYYGTINGIVGHLAIALDTSESLLDTKESLLNSVDTQRTSVSGVSIDEETTNLIVYQQSYTACARVITAIDEMLDTMIGNMGLVGR